MATRKWKTLFPTVIGLILLILDSRTAIAGAQAGIDVCFRSILPSLFPFVFLSSILTKALQAGSFKWGHILCRLYRIPYGSEGILLAGLVGGYPIGAKCIGEATSQSRLFHNEAERMMVFCNAAGPAFIFGIVGNIFEQRWIPWCLWGIQLTSGLCVARLWPSQNINKSPPHSISNLTASMRLHQALCVMGEICGWVILTRTAIAFAQKWVLQHLPQPLEILVIGILEITNGCVSLTSVGNTGLRFLICASLLSFGGLCVTLQTRSVASAVNQRKYLPRKCIQAIFSFLTAYILQFFLLTKEERGILPWTFCTAFVVFAIAMVHSIIKAKKLWKFKGT